jgi:ABC-type uncharacterized transport system substrate-binding protein
VFGSPLVGGVSKVGGIEHRYFGGDFGRLRAYTTELVSSAPDLIVAAGSPITAALKQTIGTIPIVFVVVSDPVGQGFVTSPSRPGGNITGFSFIDPPMIGKWMEMLKEIAPGVRRMMLMFNPDTALFYPAFLRELGTAQVPLAELSAAPVHNEVEIEAAMTQTFFLFISNGSATGRGLLLAAKVIARCWPQNGASPAMVIRCMRRRLPG